MEGQIVVRNIFEHTMVVMTHQLILYTTHEGKHDETSLRRTDPVTQQSTTPASTNVNYRDEGTTGGYQGIISAIILLWNNYIVE